MPIDLTQFERGTPFSGDYHATLTALQDRLARLQTSQIVHKKRAIILFEGWEGGGKKAVLKRLVGAWDPCHFAVECVGGGDERELDRHWLARFWQTLPQAGHSTIYFHSWYRRLIDDRALGRADAKQWSRGCDEINEFEAQQRDHGTLIVKLFFHVSAAVQGERLRERGEHPWRKWLIGPEDLRSHAARDGYFAAINDMFAATDTRWAPWRVIDAGDKRSARIAALTAIADAYQAAMPAEPPADGDVVMLARQKFG